MTRYILNEMVTHIDRLIDKICSSLAYPQLPTVIAATHYSEDIGNLGTPIVHQ